MFSLYEEGKLMQPYTDSSTGHAYENQIQLMSCVIDTIVNEQRASFELVTKHFDLMFKLAREGNCRELYIGRHYEAENLTKSLEDVGICKRLSMIDLSDCQIYYITPLMPLFEHDTLLRLNLADNALTTLR